MSEIRPGGDGEPLPGGVLVLRVAPTAWITEDIPGLYRVSPTAFTLSEKDKESAQPRLSVFAEDLTSPAQAWALLGADSRYGFVAHLAVDAIRAIRPMPDSLEVPSLDVVWDPICVTDDRGGQVADPRPGADGHAGITGLMRGGIVSKLHTKSLRSQFADIASVTPLG